MIERTGLERTSEIQLCREDMDLEAPAPGVEYGVEMHLAASFEVILI
jgi:hypothetical protein